MESIHEEHSAALESCKLQGEIAESADQGAGNFAQGTCESPTSEADDMVGKPDGG